MLSYVSVGFLTLYDSDVCRGDSANGFDEVFYLKIFFYDCSAKGILYQRACELLRRQNEYIGRPGFAEQ